MDSSDASFVVMDVFFNELSCDGVTEATASGIVYDFAVLVKSICEQGVHKVRYERSAFDTELYYGMSLGQYCQKHQKTQAVRALLAVHSYPYIRDEEEAVVDSYLEADAFYIEVAGVRHRSEGLAAAFLSNSVGIGLHTQNWKSLKYDLIISSGGEEKKQEVICLSLQEHLDLPEFDKWADAQLPLPVLEKTSLSPSEKSCHISKHHGMDVLDAFIKRLLRDPYVEEIVNSIDIVPDERCFISAIHHDIVEIRLVNEGGYVWLYARRPRTLGNKRLLPNIWKKSSVRRPNPRLTYKLGIKGWLWHSLICF